MNYEILFKVYEAMYPFITITTKKTASVSEYNAWADWIDYFWWQGEVNPGRNALFSKLLQCNLDQYDQHLFSPVLTMMCLPVMPLDTNCPM